MAKSRTPKASSKRKPVSAQPELHDDLNEEHMVMKSFEELANAGAIIWDPNFPKSDEEIDFSDIPPQDWSGRDVFQGRFYVPRPEKKTDS